MLICLSVHSFPAILFCFLVLSCPASVLSTYAEFYSVLLRRLGSPTRRKTLCEAQINLTWYKGTAWCIASVEIQSHESRALQKKLAIFSFALSQVDNTESMLLCSNEAQKAVEIFEKKGDRQMQVLRLYISGLSPKSSPKLCVCCSLLQGITLKQLADICLAGGSTQLWGEL